ncbi:hypothetical protein AMJ44_13865 [candidate division WOR-1 bacterium DG_54_3]|uniref:GAF domain-containing protein n=1 Tax=candidate division WOR-1 bacterium DG_54_3 TaxID=1703775 RepID=A0A0S7XN00_UNCSA|nr:MAG: hypothetical protein AMJ44_13865 [candidate division WOR-1 bacterium DG_54_3]
MDIFEKELRKVQRRDWQLWILMLTIFLIFATFIVLVIFYSDLQPRYEEQIGAQTFTFLLLGFVALSLLFVDYAVLKEVAIKKLQRDLIEQRIGSQVLEQRFRDVQAAFEVTTLVNSEMELSRILDTISSKALRILGGDQSSLLLYDPEIDKLRCVSVWGPQSHLIKNQVMEVGKSVAGWVMKHGKPLQLGENLNESQFPGFIKKDRKITSSLCVPLMVKNKAKGVLNISLFDKKKKFTETELKMVCIFAENAAASIEKAELHGKLKEQTKILKDTVVELKTAQDRLIQPQTLRALSNLVGGMAQNFNNTSTNILDKIQLLLREMVGVSVPENTKENVLEWLRTIEQLATKGAETAKHIQAFATAFQEGSEKDREELDINAIVQEAVEVTFHEGKDGAKLKGIQTQVKTE